MGRRESERSQKERNLVTNNIKAPAYKSQLFFELFNITMRVLVTGASGLLGRAVYQQFKKNGHEGIENCIYS